MTNSFPNATEVQRGQPSSDSRVEVKDREGEDPPRPEEEDVPLTMTSRLLLSAELLGAEASTGFEQLYTVPVSSHCYVVVPQALVWVLSAPVYVI